jgi:hypothetical protein
MRYKFGLSFLLQIAALIAALLPAGSAAYAQVMGGTDVNLSQLPGDQSECAIAKNPANKNQLFALCNTTGPGNTSVTGLFAARSIDGGIRWIYPDPADETIADGNPGQGPAACCDPSLAWDSFGNLFITYVDSTLTTVVTVLSTDGGATFSNLASFGPSCVLCVDQPTVVAANTSAAGAPVAVWIVWNANGSMVARGAAVTGLNAIGAFGPVQTIPGTASCNFGDIAIAPSGAVVQACESPAGGAGPATILVNTKADGLGPNPFGPAVAATTTNVGGFKFIPAQNVRGIDAEAGLAFDRNPMSPHFGRLYLIYTEEAVLGNNDTDIMLRFSDNNGGNWSAPTRVNDDPAGPIRSQFLPKIASNSLSGNIAVCWLDARNSATNTAVQEFCTIATPTGASPTFLASAQISDGASTSNGLPIPGTEFGDYSGLAYFQGVAHPIWGDTSNSGLLNPNGTSNFDAYTDRVTGGPAANEGDPHLTTVDGVHYDFQGAGEFVALRDYDGLEIQIRKAPIATTFNPGPDPYDELAVCVSLNTAVAVAVAGHRVSYEPNISGVPDPSGLQLRVDGELTTLDSQGIDLGNGGRVVNSAAGNGSIEIDFPNETVMFVVPNWWASQSKWYLNVDVFHTPAVEGVLGAIARDSWLPALPDGTSLGPMPAGLHQRYVDLYQTFADAWRVDNETSLFDYAAGTSTETFTLQSWPPESPPCVLPEIPPVNPADPITAHKVCRPIVGENRKADCVFDVTVTGERGFARIYQLSQLIELGSTTTTVHDDKDPTQFEEHVTFTATVAPTTSSGVGVPTGTVQFILDGSKIGERIKLDAKGEARWRTSHLKIGEHKVAASYTPSKGIVFLASRSLDESHTVTREKERER